VLRCFQFYAAAWEDYRSSFLWIGGIEVDGQWRWKGMKYVDITVADWAVKQPSGNGNCLQLFGEDNYQWNDQNCSLPFYFLCESS